MWHLMFKQVPTKVHFQQNFNETKNDSCDILGNLDSMSLSMANLAKLAFFNDRYRDHPYESEQLSFMWMNHWKMCSQPLKVTFAS